MFDIFIRFIRIDIVESNGGLAAFGLFLFIFYLIRRLFAETPPFSKTGRALLKIVSLVIVVMAFLIIALALDRGYREFKGAPSVFIPLEIIPSHLATRVTI
ncbi:MAG TPA: hypothetical protein VJB56_01430 [Candidatus Paceibacterota bacterium]